MCSSNSTPHTADKNMAASETIARINGRPVLQPKSNQIHALDRRNSFKKPSRLMTPLALHSTTMISPSAKAGNPNSIRTPPISPKMKLSPRPPPALRGKDLCTEVVTPSSMSSADKTVKRSNSFSGPVKYSSSQDFEKAGSIAAARREEVAMMQERRKLKIAHYGRTKPSTKVTLQERKAALFDSQETVGETEKKRCSFITPNSDPIYVSYHDEEWGVPVHDDKLLFELLVLTSAQVGSDWTSVLKKRQNFRKAFSGFDTELVANYSDKKIQLVSSDYGIDLGQVLAAVDNSKQILQVKKQFGSFGKYLWAFVNHKPIKTHYKTCHKIPTKTSKSEAISKDLIRRGFRFVGPTVIHSFMQASGLTNDHLVTCPRHIQCRALASQPAPAL